MSHDRRKLSYAEVAQYFREQGCELLAQEYINSHVKMPYRCVCGNVSSIKLNNFKNGKRCGCGRIGIKRLTSEEVEAVVTKKGYDFVACEYVEDKGHMVTYKCTCGMQKTSTLESLKQSSRCHRCATRSFALSYDEVKQYFYDQGCELLSDTYVNARTKLKYRCSCGKESEITFYSFKTGVRCWDCGREKVRQASIGPRHYSWIEDRESLKEYTIIRHRCYSILRATLKAVGKNKQHRTHVLLGYTPLELKDRLEQHANWPMVKDQVWHVDHIFPIRAFVEYGIDDLGLINCLENLQPLGYKENIAKSDNYDASQFEAWLSSKGVKFCKVK
jgi:hypothetical protein